jgi:hypothetical protein
MDRNVSGLDRIARLVVGIVLMGVGFGAIGGPAGIAVGVVGAIVTTTGLVGRSATYALFGVNTYIRV